VSRVEFEEVFSSKPRMKILKLLARLGTLNVSEIAKRIGLNYSATNEHLRLLEAESLLVQRSYGRVRMYRFNEASARAKAVQALIETWEQTNNNNNSTTDRRGITV
jgi:DNA-binding transcriptional ArsR family regulator